MILLPFYSHSSDDSTPILLPFFWWLYSHSTRFLLIILLPFYWWFYAHSTPILLIILLPFYSLSTDNSTPILRPFYCVLKHLWTTEFIGSRYSHSTRLQWRRMNSKAGPNSGFLTFSLLCKSHRKKHYCNNYMLIICTHMESILTKCTSSTPTRPIPALLTTRPPAIPLLGICLGK